jgi:hypothetical protein
MMRGGMARRLFLVIAFLLVGGLGYVAGSGHLLAPQRAVAADECQTFVETGKQVCGRFLEYWRSNGGLAQQGLPLSNTFEEKNAVNQKIYTVQYFERAVFEAHPENQRPYDVLLSLLGSEKYQAKYPNGPGGPVPSTGPTPTPQPSTAPSAYPRSGNGDGYTITIYEVRDPSPAGQYTKPAGGNHFVAFDLLIKNTGPDAISSNRLYFRLRTGDGRDWEAIYGAPLQPEIKLIDLQPNGGDTRAWVTFEIPDGSTLVSLTFDHARRDAPAVVSLR